jgi:subfamily B ATP-binding cassette protein MsbA
VSFEVLEVENEITSKENAIVKTTFESDITISNINFKYEDENVLKDFHFKLKGQTVPGQSGRKVPLLIY